MLMLNRMEKENYFQVSMSHEYIELGAGVIPMSKLDSRIKSTDIVPTAHLNGVLDTTILDIEDSTVSGFILQNTFHHIHDPEAFFQETSRVLTLDGRIVILDPYFNRLLRWLYPRLFKSEDFDTGGSWKGPNQHAMIGANQALSYIVFERDRAYFDSTFPELRIIEKLPVCFDSRYILTGGLNFRKTAPGFIFSKSENWKIPPGCSIFSPFAGLLCRKTGRELRGQRKGHNYIKILTTNASLNLWQTHRS